MTEKELTLLFNSSDIKRQKVWAKYCLDNEHNETKELLEKYKEDVEQVELFGMERNDYEEKKTACVELITKLRAIEAAQKALNDAQDEKSLFESVCAGKKFIDMNNDVVPSDRQYVKCDYTIYDTAIVKNHYLVDKEVIIEERPEERAGFIIVEMEYIEEKRIIVGYEYQPKPIIYAERPEEKEGYYLVSDYIEQETQIVGEWRYEKMLTTEVNDG